VNRVYVVDNPRAGRVHDHVSI